MARGNQVKIFVEYEGKKLPLIDAAAAAGINRTSTYNVMRDMNISMQEAFNYLLARKLNRIPRRSRPYVNSPYVIYQGQRRVMYEVCAELGIKKISIYSRMKLKDCSRQEAFEWFVKQRTSTFAMPEHASC